MPELLEVEAYRRAAEVAVGGVIQAVEVLDPRCCRALEPETDLRRVCVGRTVAATGRRGKVAWLDLAPPPGEREAGVRAVRLGLRFGMTGRLLVGDVSPVGELLYGPGSTHSRWDRLVLHLDRGPVLRLHDPRRLGGVELDPDLSRLGPDALGVDSTVLATVLGAGVGPLKARLLDQSRLAGLGNLLVDEALWRAGLSPVRPACSLSADETERLSAAIRDTLAILGERGGSHLGDLQAQRRRGGRCPADGQALRMDRVGGRTTYWCPLHQH